MIEFTLPFPPSVNGMFAGKGRRYVSKPYKAWRAAAGWELKRQRVCAVISGPVILEIELTPPDKRPRDASNYVKGIEDLAVAHGILVDDSQQYVKEVRTRWATEPGQPGARVRITPAG